ncbi:MAG: right-handed parallel beta-helix repeat-containing protein [Nanoarchaeota archaeon]
MSNVVNATVKNCFITNFTRAISLDDVNDSLFDNNTIYANNGDFSGLYMINSSRNIISNFNFSNNNASNNTGVYMLFSNNNHIDNNTFRFNTLFAKWAPVTSAVLTLDHLSNNNIINHSVIEFNNATSSDHLYCGGMACIAFSQNNTFDNTYIHSNILNPSTHMYGGLMGLFGNSDTTSSNNTIRNLTVFSNNVTSGSDCNPGLGLALLNHVYSNTFVDINITSNNISCGDDIDVAGILGAYKNVSDNTFSNVSIVSNTVAAKDIVIAGMSNIAGDSNNNLLENFNIFDNTIHSGTGLFFAGSMMLYNSAHNNTLSHMTIMENTLSSSPYAGGIILLSGGAAYGQRPVTNNTLSNIIMRNASNLGPGILFLGDISNNKLLNSEIRHIPDYAIILTSNLLGFSAEYGLNTTFDNVTVLESPNGSLWIYDSNNVLFNQTFINSNFTSSVVLENPNGSINYTSGINFTSQVNLYDVLNISNNSITVNSSLATGMNRSAVVKLHSLPFTNVHVEYALDDVTFVNCTPSTDPACTSVSYINNNLTFTTSHFTRFIAADGNATDTTNPDINFTAPTTAAGTYTQTFITVNVTATDDFAIDTINITLWNAAGYVNSTNSSVSPLFINFTGLSYGTYYLNATVNDTSGNINTTETRTIILQAAAATGPTCGDGACNGVENCESCPGDCGCEAGYACVAGACQVIGLSPAPSLAPAIAPPVPITPSSPPLSTAPGYVSLITKQTGFANSPCYTLRYTERNELLYLTKATVSSKLIPEGYELITDPVKLDCLGESVDLTFNIPENYKDLRAMKCRQDNCYDISLSEVEALKCGEIIYERQRQTTNLTPESMPIKIQETSINLSEANLLASGSNSIQFYSMAGVRATLSMPNISVSEAVNTRFKIMGTPVILRLDDILDTNITLTLPYPEEDGVLSETINLYVKVGDEWEFIGGNVDTKNKLVTATVTDIGQYGDEMMFALMGAICTYCHESELEKVYEPKISSRDAIILIHGFASSSATYQPLIDDIRLTDQPFTVYTFGYPMTETAEQIADELTYKIENVSDEFDRLYIVSHSLGGLIAQKAVYNAYQQNRGYVNKIRKIVLVSVPNEGSPVISAYKKLFGALINKDSPLALFSVSTELVDYLEKGEVIPTVPGINYRVISGIRNYELDFLFSKVELDKLFKQYNLSDGILSLKSAQHVGDSYIKDKCSNYWEINNTHTEILDDFTTRKLIERVVSEEILGQSMFGRNLYLEMHIDDCSPYDAYILIGKRINLDEIYDSTSCLCGNGVCGEGENAINCPSDCAQAMAPSRPSYLLLLALIFAVMASVLTIFFVFKLFRRVVSLSRKLKRKK